MVRRRICTSLLISLLAALGLLACKLPTAISQRLVTGSPSLTPSETQLALATAYPIPETGTREPETEPVYPGPVPAYPGPGEKTPYPGVEDTPVSQDVEPGAYPGASTATNYSGPQFTSPSPTPSPTLTRTETSSQWTPTPSLTVSVTNTPTGTGEPPAYPQPGGDNPPPSSPEGYPGPGGYPQPGAYPGLELTSTPALTPTHSPTGGPDSTTTETFTPTAPATPTVTTIGSPAPSLSPTPTLYQTPTPTLTPTPTWTLTPLPPPPWVSARLRSSDPRTTRLASGKVQLVEFFAYWSGPSQAMAPIVQGLETEYRDQMIFTYLDIDDPATRIFQSQLKFRTEPHFFLLDPQGRILRQWVGYVTPAQFRQAFEEALGS